MIPVYHSIYNRSRGAATANRITLCNGHGTDFVTVTGQPLRGRPHPTRAPRPHIRRGRSCPPVHGFIPYPHTGRTAPAHHHHSTAPARTGTVNRAWSPHPPPASGGRGSAPSPVPLTSPPQRARRRGQEPLRLHSAAKPKSKSKIKVKTVGDTRTAHCRVSGPCSRRTGSQTAPSRRLWAS